jgi:hypothetical protein
VNHLDETTRRRVLVLLGLALLALLGRLVTDALGAPATVSRGLYLFALGSMGATVLVVATE